MVNLQYLKRGRIPAWVKVRARVSIIRARVRVRVKVAVMVTGYPSSAMVWSSLH